MRFPIFETDDVRWKYGTHGGTIFVVSHRGKPFALTCRHVFGDFDRRRLRITDEKFGRVVAPLQSLHYASQPRDYATDSDVLDIAVIEFTKDVGAEFFKGTAYITDANTVGTSGEGDVLYVNGNLKKNSKITDSKIIPEFGLIDLCDCGAVSSDVSLRKARAEYKEPKFSSLSGLSGSPVFNATKKRLCGMTVRAGLEHGACTLWYIDIFDIIKVLDAILDERPQIYYEKKIRRLLTAG